MEPIIILPAKQVEELIKRYEDATARLIEAEKELQALKEDRFVTWDWVCEYFSISKKTALSMLEDEKIFVHGQKLKRIRKSMLLRFAEKNSIKVKDVPIIPYLHRRNK